LIDNIRRARLNPRMTPDQRMEIYTQHLQFLVDEGVVTTDQANELLEQKRIALRSEKPKVVSLVK
jgi:ribosomal protein S16